jgi:hypothetical protein
VPQPHAEFVGPTDLLPERRTTGVASTTGCLSRAAPKHPSTETGLLLMVGVVLLRIIVLAGLTTWLGWFVWCCSARKFRYGSLIVDVWAAPVTVLLTRT